MKKNLKFVSAAAAALLAVAPVAASTVNANAAVTVNGATNSSSSTNTTTAADGAVTVNFSLNASAGTTVANALKSVSLSVNGATIANSIYSSTNTTGYKVSIRKQGTTSDLDPNTELATNTKYQIYVSGLKLKNLTTGKTYTVSGGTVDGIKTETNNAGFSATNLMSGFNFTSDVFNVYDQKATGSVEFAAQSGSSYTVVTSGSVDLGSITTVSGLVSAIEAKYSPINRTGNASVNWGDVTKAVTDALTNNGVKVTKGSFSAPASSFTVNVPAVASNGKTATLPVTINVNTKSKASTTIPTITLSNTTQAVKGTNSPYTAQLGVNSSTTAATIASYFSATYTLTNNNNTYTTPVSVKSSNLNTSVVGNYTVVLEATNPITGETKDVTVNVTVGDPTSIKTVQAGNATAKVITISGNNVTETSSTLANGTKVATFGTVTVNGTSYTRLNSEYSNQYVLTKYVDGSIKPSEKTATTRVYLMKMAYIYNEKHQSQGSYKIYSGHDVVAKNGKAEVFTLSNGTKAFKLANGAHKDQYIDIRNVKGYGVEKTVKTTARTFNAKGKAIKGIYGRYIKKGKKVATYGTATIKGHKMYIIAKGQYVKVANFR